jgi:hypothetical protein
MSIQIGVYDFFSYTIPGVFYLAAATSLPVLRTDLVGWVELVTNGDTLWVQVEDD